MSIILRILHPIITSDTQFFVTLRLFLDYPPVFHLFFSMKFSETHLVRLIFRLYSKNPLFLNYFLRIPSLHLCS